MTNPSSSIVEVRVFKEAEKALSWEEIPINSHLPIFTKPSQAIDNVTKRIRLIYFKNASDIWKVRWNFRGESQGYWVDSENSEMT
ncbi:hypothetical protein HOH87_07840 [bacterium]|jgi:hypothetical protein|nr:hypothetical protein [bacterium]